MKRKRFTSIKPGDVVCFNDDYHQRTPGEVLRRDRDSLRVLPLTGHTRHPFWILEARYWYERGNLTLVEIE